MPSTRKTSKEVVFPARGSTYPSFLTSSSADEITVAAQLVICTRFRCTLYRLWYGVGD